MISQNAAGTHFINGSLEAGAKPGNILFRLDNMEQATKDEVWNDPATNEPTDFKPLGRWLRFSKEGRKRFYETATVVMTDFGRCESCNGRHFGLALASRCAHCHRSPST